MLVFCKNRHILKNIISYHLNFAVTKTAEIVNEKILHAVEQKDEIKCDHRRFYYISIFVLMRQITQENKRDHLKR